MPNHKRPLDGSVEMHGRRDDCDCAGDACERDRGNCCSQERADAAELAAALCVLELESREQRVAAELRGRPAECEQAERGPGHRHAHGEDDQAQLAEPERYREPAGLVVEQAVVDAGRARRRSRASARRARPPTSGGSRARAGARRGASRRGATGCGLSACTPYAPARNARAAYLAPASVSAAGNAHWAGAPASESVRPLSVSAGTVESGASTIHRRASRARESSTRSRQQRVVAASPGGSLSRRSPAPPRSAAVSTTERAAALARSTGSSQSRPGGIRRRRGGRGAAPLRSPGPAVEARRARAL